MTNHALTPYITVKGAANAIEFYKKVFGAVESAARYTEPGGRIGHAEIEIEGARLMLSDEYPDWDALSPSSRGGATGSFMVYVPDADAAVERAVKAGAKVVQPVENQFWGDRTGVVVDPFGHKWMLGTHIEDVSPQEMQRRGEEWARKNS